MISRFFITMNTNEIFKDIPNYEGIYQVSNLGVIKSLERLIKIPKGFRSKKQSIMKTPKGSNGYLTVELSKHSKGKHFKVHQLVAIAFLNHEPCGMKLVVNHINFDKTDNRVENLELVTARENSNRKHLKSTSKYTGVCLPKNDKKWKATIRVNNKQIHLGMFNNEYDAHLTYQNALKNIQNETTI